jgi:hypothetical protein
MDSAEAPERALITTAGALTWIAFRKAMTYGEWIGSCFPDFETWQTTDSKGLLHALEAQAKPAPHCAAGPSCRAPPFLRDGLGYPTPFLRDPVGCLTVPLLRNLQRRVSRKEGRTVTYAELAAMLKAELAAIEHRKAAMRRAVTELLETIRRGSKLEVVGRPDRAGAQPDPGA